MSLIFNIFPYYVSGDFITYTPDKISIAPKLPSPQLLPQFREFLEHFSSRYALQYLNYLRRRVLRWRFYKYMHVVFHHFHRVYMKLILVSNPPKYLFQILPNIAIQYIFPILRYPDQVILNIINSVLCSSYAHAAVIQEKVPLRQAFFLRLAATRFPPASKLAGIQRGFL